MGLSLRARLLLDELAKSLGGVENISTNFQVLIFGAELRTKVYTCMYIHTPTLTSAHTLPLFAGTQTTIGCCILATLLQHNGNF